MNLAKFLHLDHEKNIFMINGRLILNEIDKNQASRPLLQDDPIIGQKQWTIVHRLGPPSCLPLIFLFYTDSSKKYTHF